MAAISRWRARARWPSSQRRGLLRSPTTGGRSPRQGSCATRSSTARSQGDCLRSTARSRASRGGHVHEGRVSAEVGLGPYHRPREPDGATRSRARGRHGAPLHLMHLSARESVEALTRARGRHGDRRGDAASPLPHGRGRPEPDPNTKMNPPLRGEEDRMALISALRDGSISAIATDHAPHARQRRRPSRTRPSASSGSRRPLRPPYASRGARGAPAHHAARADVGGRPVSSARRAGDRGRRTGEPGGSRPRCRVDGDRGRLPLAFCELVAARRDVARAGRAPSPTGERCTPHDQGLPLTRGRDGLSRSFGRRRRSRLPEKRSSRPR